RVPVTRGDRHRAVADRAKSVRNGVAIHVGAAAGDGPLVGQEVRLRGYVREPDDRVVLLGEDAARIGDSIIALDGAVARIVEKGAACSGVPLAGTRVRHAARRGGPQRLFVVAPGQTLA